MSSHAIAFPYSRHGKDGKRNAKLQRHVVTVCFLPTVLLLCQSPAHAEDLYWVCGSGDWDSGLGTPCWSTTPGGTGSQLFPLVGDSAYLTQAGVTDITVEYHEQVAGPLFNLAIDATGSGTMTLSQVAYGGDLLTEYETVGDLGTGNVVLSNGTHTVTNELILGYTATGDGSYALSGNGSLTTLFEHIGYEGSGHFTQDGGTHDATNLAIGSAGTGTYDLHAGTLWSVYQTVGDGGTGSFVQDGGTNTVTTYLHLGLNNTGDGTYALSGSGELSVQGYEYVGYEGTGYFTQDGGTHSAINLTLGNLSAGNGTYDLHAGALTVAYETVGDGGTGSFVQDGGTNTVTNYLHLGLNDTGNGTYLLTGSGELSVQVDENIGYNGTGSFTQTSGTHTVANSLVLGNSVTGDGSYALSGNGSLTTLFEHIGYEGTGSFVQDGGMHAATNLAIGSAGTGTYDLHAGALWSVYQTVGDGGTGSFVQDGGTNTVTTYLHLGLNNTGDGTYTLSGSGDLSVQGHEYVGYEGTGYFTQDGGTHSTINLTLGNLSAGNGTYDLHAGMLTVAYAAVGDGGTGSFVQDGGTNTVTNYLHLGLNDTGNGTYLLTGSGELSVQVDENIGYNGTGIFTQTGGTHTVTNNLNFGNAATGSGSYELNGGILAVGGSILTGDGSGILTIDGGALTVGGGNGSIEVDTFNIGRDAGVAGSHTLSGSGSVETVFEHIGFEGTGHFTQDGGMHSAINLTLGTLSAGNGSYDLHAGNAWSVYQTVGDGGTGSFVQDGGTNTVTTYLHLGLNDTGVGTYTLSGSAVLSVDGDENIGYNGTGIFTQTGGTHTVANDINLGYSATGNGTYYLNGGVMNVGGNIVYGPGTGAFQFNAGTLNLSNDLMLGPTGLLADLHLTSAHALAVGGATILEEGATLTLDGGSFSTGSLTDNGSFAFYAGTLNVSSDLLIETGGSFANLNLSGLHTLAVGGTTRLGGSAHLSLDGGSFSTGSLVNNGGFSFTKGTFNLTSADLTIGNGGLFGNLVEFDNYQLVNVTNNATVDDGAILALNGGILTSGSLTNNGLIQLSGSFSSLGGGSFSNFGEITGNGRINSTLYNQSTGEVRVGSGESLRLSAAGNTNAGRIEVIGGEIEFDQDLLNQATTGNIIARNASLRFSGGLDNQGSLGLSFGISDVFGDIDNTGIIIQSGGGLVTFFDDMINNGVIQVSAGSQAVFFGNASGSGSYSGSGTVFFEGGLNPGNSPGLVNIEGDMGLGLSSHTIMEIAGLERGNEYDAFDIGGDLWLGGELEVSLYGLGTSLFTPRIGDSFDLFQANSITGDFDLLTLASLDGGLGWQLDVLADAIGLTDVVRLSVVASTVPVPPSVWLFCSGLLGLIGIARRRQVA